jgi:hypothetical protein
MARRTGPQESQKKSQKKSPKQKQGPKPRRKSKTEVASGSATGAAAAASRRAAPFPKKNQPPSEAEFLARIPVAAGKKLESLRTFLGKQRGVAESLFFFGPKTGWAYRYLRGEQSVATLMLHAGHLMGIVALDGPALSKIDFAALSPVATAARKAAHGSPSLSWLDLPVDGTGAGDFKVLVKAKLRTMPPPPLSASSRPGSADGVGSADGAGPVEAAVAHPPPRGRANRA